MVALEPQYEIQTAVHRAFMVFPTNFLIESICHCVNLINHQLFRKCEGGNYGCISYDQEKNQRR